MAQIFRPSANVIAKASMVGAVIFLAVFAKALDSINRSPYYTQVNVNREQPVPFSHKHHVGGLGIDCRYCHTSVETSSRAGIPPTKTCMNCHSAIWPDAAVLEPVRKSFQTGEPIEWTRVNDLPDYVYFNHSIHVAKGVGCATCHGQVDQMPLTSKANTLHMEWCLSCHRNPEKYVRPKEEVFNMNWKPEGDQETLGRELVKKYNIQKLTNCSACHR